MVHHDTSDRDVRFEMLVRAWWFPLAVAAASGIAVVIVLLLLATFSTPQQMISTR